MPITNASKILDVARADNPKEGILVAIGDLSGVTVMFNQILVATYVAPEKTRGGIIRPNSAVDEDKYQGKVNLVLKVGPTAFINDDGTPFEGETVKEGDWIVSRVGDGWALTVNGVPCRVLTDRNIRLKIADPQIVF